MGRKENRKQVLLVVELFDRIAGVLSEKTTAAETYLPEYPAVVAALRTAAVDLASILGDGSGKNNLQLTRDGLPSVEKVDVGLTLLAWHYLAAMDNIKTGEPLIFPSVFSVGLASDVWTVDKVEELDRLKREFFTTPKEERPGIGIYPDMLYRAVYEVFLGHDPLGPDNRMTEMLSGTMLLTIIHRSTQPYWLALVSGEQDFSVNERLGFMTTWQEFQKQHS